jgi:acetylornithine deacetylase/succinyl-diaminopimelate desuccinylase-like protein
MLKRPWILVGLLVATQSASPATAVSSATIDAPMPALRPDQVTFLALFKELVETNTTLSAGSCTLAAERMAARLRAAGFPDADITLFSAPDHPKEGGLVAILHGRSSTAKAVLLLGHLDVVEAKREDWTRDPFTMIEENGRFYGRGTLDMKNIDAIWVDLLMRLRRSGYRPQRSIKLALTCGEETIDAFNSLYWLVQNRPELVAAEFALNEGGGGLLDEHGKMIEQDLVVAEKTTRNYRLEATNPGGHSSIPVRDNAIYELADALVKVRAYEFPMKVTPINQAYFAKTGAIRGDELGRAMVALAQKPDDAAALAEVSKDRVYNALLHTTCVATLLDGGHASNALPQRAGANVNCRIFPGETAEGTRAALEAAIGDPRVKVTLTPRDKPPASPAPLDPRIVHPAQKLVEKYFPNVPLVPVMATGSSDGPYLQAIGIPVYGVPGIWADSSFNGVHGLNEYISARSLFVGRDLMTELVKVYANSN